MYIENHHGGARARWRENGQQRSRRCASREDAEQFKALSELVGIEAALAFVAGDETPARHSDRDP